MNCASDLAFTTTAPVWLKLVTESMLAVVLFLMIPKDRPTPYAAEPPIERPPPTITRFVSSVAITFVSPTIVTLLTFLSRALVV